MQEWERERNAGVGKRRSVRERIQVWERESEDTGV